MTHNMETEDFSSLVPRLEELARAEDEFNSPAPLLRAATKQDDRPARHLRGRTAPLDALDLAAAVGRREPHRVDLPRLRGRVSAERRRGVHPARASARELGAVRGRESTRRINLLYEYVVKYYR